MDSFLHQIIHIYTESTNQGTDWEQVGNGLPDVFIYQISKELSDNIFLATSKGLYSSKDYGINFTLIDSIFANTYIEKILFCNNQSIFSLTSKGIYKSTDAGLNWILLNNIPSGGGEIIDFVCDSSNNLFIVKYVAEFITDSNG